MVRSISIRRWAVAWTVALACGWAGVVAHAQETAADETFTPLRLSYLEGEVSFWRPGAADWVAARINTPLEAGDGLYTAQRGDFELQLGGGAFIRAAETTQLTLVDQEAGFLQFDVTGGRVSFDLRELPAGYTLEVDTPDAVFTIQNPGYYRLEVGAETRFVTRRGGLATVIPAGGAAQRILPSEEVVVQDGGQARVSTYVAPEPDQWDQWNYTRTEDLIDAASARYLPPGVAGADDLDQYGSWRMVADYGPVWVPQGEAPDWVPYSTGSWVWDPNYEWTWVDDAPWGWTPYHYGRWVYVDGVWAWAPGPVPVHRPAYAPALVAFFGVGSGAAARLHLGGPGVGWVALGWGEPLVPWWGRPGFRGKPTWRGWHGPRLEDHGAVHPGRPFDIHHLHFRNADLHHAIVFDPDEHFGRDRGHRPFHRLSRSDELAPVEGALPVRPDAERLVGGARKGIQPPRALVTRPVVTAHPKREARPAWEKKPANAARETPPQGRYVVPPRGPGTELPRPGFGAQGGRERERPPPPSPFGALRQGNVPGRPPPVAPTPRGEAPRHFGAPERPAPTVHEPHPAAPHFGPVPARERPEVLHPGQESGRRATPAMPQGGAQPRETPFRAVPQRPASPAQEPRPAAPHSGPVPSRERHEVQHPGQESGRRATPAPPQGAARAPEAPFRPFRAVPQRPSPTVREPRETMQRLHQGPAPQGREILHHRVENPQPAAPAVQAPPQAAGGQQSEPQRLPGRPANQLYRHRDQRGGEQRR